MRVETVLTGTSALVMKNPQLADPDNEFVKQIAHIVAKGAKMTEVDRQEKSKLQFLGALYVHDGRPYLPTSNLRRCFIAAATIRRLGKGVERALIPVSQRAELDYPGPRDITALWEDPAYRYVTMVNGNPSRGKKSMLPSTRPWFPKWTVVAEWELVEDALDYDNLVDVVEVAGRIEGLGDNRRNGFGRFTGEVRKP